MRRYKKPAINIEIIKKHFKSKLVPKRRKVNWVQVARVRSFRVFLELGPMFRVHMKRGFKWYHPYHILGISPRTEGWAYYAFEMKNCKQKWDIQKRWRTRGNSTKFIDMLSQVGILAWPYSIWVRPLGVSVKSYTLGASLLVKKWVVGPPSLTVKYNWRKHGYSPYYAIHGSIKCIPRPSCRTLHAKRLGRIFSLLPFSGALLQGNPLFRHRVSVARNSRILFGRRDRRVRKFASLCVEDTGPSIKKKNGFKKLLYRTHRLNKKKNRIIRRGKYYLRYKWKIEKAYRRCMNRKAQGYYLRQFHFYRLYGLYFFWSLYLFSKMCYFINRVLFNYWFRFLYCALGSFSAKNNQHFFNHYLLYREIKANYCYVGLEDVSTTFIHKMLSSSYVTGNLRVFKAMGASYYANYLNSLFLRCFEVNNIGNGFYNYDYMLGFLCKERWTTRNLFFDFSYSRNYKVKKKVKPGFNWVAKKIDRKYPAYFKINYYKRRILGRKGFEDYVKVVAKRNKTIYLK